MIYPQMLLDVEQEIVVVGFAGGGGYCHGWHRATGRDVHLAINHDPDAISLHKANHPQTQHIESDVFEVDMRKEVAERFGNRPVGWVHTSPDCRDHSGAKNGPPIRDVISRSLGWIGLRWVGQVRPRIFTLENVPEWRGWDSLVAKRCPKTGRVVKLDGTVAAPGERVPVQNQHLQRVSLKKNHVGRRFKRFVRSLRQMGYTVDWWLWRASDVGAPTKRVRLFLMARCDGRPIVRPPATHGDPAAPGFKERRLKPWQITGDCIDWAVRIPSIFLTREQARAWGKAHGCAPPKRPLAEPTMRRLARGTFRYVIHNRRPYLVRGREAAELAAGFTVPRYGERDGQAPRAGTLQEPGPTVVPDGNGASLVVVHFSTYHGAKGDDVRGGGMDEPSDTIDTSNRHAVVGAFLARHNGGFYTGPGLPLDGPAGAVCASGSPQGIVAAGLVHLRGRSDTADIRTPGGAATTSGGHHGVFAVHMFPNTTGSAGYGADEPGAAVTAAGNQVLAAAFLLKYYGTDQDPRIDEPGDTVTTVDRFSIVVVIIDGQSYVLTDIGMRMFTPRENFNLQGFARTFIIDRGHDGRKLTKKVQLRLAGNAVPPQFVEALVRANAPEFIVRDEALRPKRRGRKLAGAL